MDAPYKQWQTLQILHTRVNEIAATLIEEKDLEQKSGFNGYLLSWEEFKENE